MSNIDWAHKRRTPPTPIVPRSRIPSPVTAPAKAAPVPGALPEIKVSQFGMSFTYYGPAAPPMPPGIMSVIRRVAAEHGLDEYALTGESRRHEVVVARHHAMWECAQRKRWSFSRIGRAFNKDHTTVLNGIFRHEQRMAVDQNRSAD